jgi:2-amino-4-hydroxy-6-hydroxymethyldihydropteridine diphosphokinase/dihydropteroate synthase
MIILGLGCNIGNRLNNLREALNHLRKLDNLKIIQVSPLYESDAMLPENAPDSWNQPFLNLAVSCQTSLAPEELFDRLQQIEHQLGRRAHERWSPRTIDIDILAWHDRIYQSNRLHIPHPGLLNRPFALWPLADLIPDWIYPALTSQNAGKPIQELIKTWGSRFEALAPFHTHQISHRVDTPKIVGVLNITPDSFSDGGQYDSIEAAIKQAESLFQEGADIIDIGAESTRPNAESISEELEWDRLVPVLQAIYALWPSKLSRPEISIDTRKSKIAEKALNFDVDWINDVSGFDSLEMRSVVRDAPVKIVFMHHLGIPPRPDLIVPIHEDIVHYLNRWAQLRLESLIEAGIDRSRLIFDVGIGFGKSAEQSSMLIKRIDEFKNLDIPLLVGHSRKSFLKQFTAVPTIDRDLETSIISNFLAHHSIDYLRVHNVDATMRTLKITSFFQ